MNPSSVISSNRMRRAVKPGVFGAEEDGQPQQPAAGTRASIAATAPTWYRRAIKASQRRWRRLWPAHRWLLLAFFGAVCVVMGLRALGGGGGDDGQQSQPPVVSLAAIRGSSSSGGGGGGSRKQQVDPSSDGLGSVQGGGPRGAQPKWPKGGDGDGAKGGPAPAPDGPQPPQPPPQPPQQGGKGGAPPRQQKKQKMLSHLSKVKGKAGAAASVAAGVALQQEKKQEPGVGRQGKTRRAAAEEEQVDDKASTLDGASEDAPVVAAASFSSSSSGSIKAEGEEGLRSGPMVPQMAVEGSSALKEAAAMDQELFGPEYDDDDDDVAEAGADDVGVKGAFGGEQEEDDADDDIQEMVEFEAQEKAQEQEQQKKEQDEEEKDEDEEEEDDEGAELGEPVAPGDKGAGQQPQQGEEDEQTGSEVVAAAVAEAAGEAAFDPEEEEPDTTKDVRGEAMEEAAAPPAVPEPEPAAPAPAGNGAGAAALAAASSGAEPAAAAAAATAVTAADGTQDEEPPQFMYCFPNGGFNDICVQAWRCVEYARRTGRVLVLGSNNYVPQVPPYDPYFRFAPMDGVKLMTQEEAARALEAAKAAGEDVDVYPRRVKLGRLLGKDHVGRVHRAEGRPLFVNVDKVPQFVFDFNATHDQRVTVYHKKGNIGAGDDTLRHLVFSDEVKRTFLARWARLPQPYIGFHIRSTDRSCTPEKFAAILKNQVQRLARRPQLQGAPVYLATDNPQVPEPFRAELEDVQGREIVSFTYHPPERSGPAGEEDEEEGGGGGGGGGGRKRGKKGRKKKQQRKAQQEEEEGVDVVDGEGKKEGKPEPLHLNSHLTPEEKHRTNVDGFVDLLLLAFSKKIVTTCGGYTRLARFLHGEKATALSLIGEAMEEGQTPEKVLAAAVEQLGLGERD